MNVKLSPQEIVALHKILANVDDPRLAKFYAALTKEIIHALTQLQSTQLDLWFSEQEKKISTLHNNESKFVTRQQHRPMETILNDDDDQIDVESRYPKKRPPAPNMPRLNKRT